VSSHSSLTASIALVVKIYAKRRKLYAGFSTNQLTLTHMNNNPREKERHRHREVMKWSADSVRRLIIMSRLVD
jgi:hypothetical protein